LGSVAFLESKKLRQSQKYRENSGIAEGFTICPGIENSLEPPPFNKLDDSCAAIARRWGEGATISPLADVFLGIVNKVAILNERRPN